MIRVKRTLQPIIIGDEIVFGYGNPILERHFKNSDLFISTIKKLDYGINNINELNSEEKTIYDKLLSSGCITNNSYDDSMYSRNINFYEWIDMSENTNPYVYNDIIKKSKILIVGLGGIGSNIAEILLRTGIENFILIDYDLVDFSNITRQGAFTKNDIGLQKTFVCKKYMQNICRCNITTIEERIDSKNKLKSIYDTYEFDIAICCADEPYLEIDYWFDALSNEYNRKFISGSYASTVINTLCISPKRTISLKDFYGNYKITDDNILNNKNKTSVIAPISYMASGLISYKAIMELTGLKRDDNAVQIDLLDWNVSIYDLKK